MPEPERREDVGDLKRLVAQIEWERVVRYRVVKAAFAVSLIALTVACFSLVISFGDPFFGTYDGLLHKTNQSRFDNTRLGCLESNAANRDAKAFVLESPLGREFRVTTNKLIDQLRPYRADCTAYANLRVKDPR